MLVLSCCQLTARQDDSRNLLKRMRLGALHHKAAKIGLAAVDLAKVAMDTHAPHARPRQEGVSPFTHDITAAVAVELELNMREIARHG